MIMSQTNCTPVPYWLSLPLPQLGAWIGDSNGIQKGIRQQIEQGRQDAKRRRR